MVSGRPLCVSLEYDSVSLLPSMCGRRKEGRFVEGRGG